MSEQAKDGGPARRVFYDCSQYAERYTKTTADDAIDAVVRDTIADHLPESLTAYAHRQRDHRGYVTADDVLDNALTGLNDEYGDPDEAPDYPQALVDAAEAFCAAVDEHYETWSCERAPELDVTVNVREWIAQRARRAEARDE